MNFRAEVMAKFGAELVTLRKSLAAAREAQRNAPSAMESHSDTTRSEKEKLVTALELEISNLTKKLKSLDKFDLKIIETEINGGKIKCCLVPDGLGGKRIGVIQLVSVGSTLGRRIYEEC